MLESLILIAMFLASCFAVLISIILLIIGVSRKSQTFKVLGIAPLIIPIGSIIIYSLWYGVALPNVHEEERDKYVGVYRIEGLDGANSNQALQLLQDKTFVLDSIGGMNFSGKGKWETGGIDGVFNFYSSKGRLLDVAYPSSSTTLTFMFFDDGDIIFSRLLN
jgi:hypothetical protein